MNPFMFRDKLTAAAGQAPGRRKIAPFGAVAWCVAGGISVALLGVLARVAQLQVAPSEALRQHFEPRITRRTELPLRGEIVDRRNRPLSVTRFGFRVVVDPTLLPPDIDGAITKLAEAMEQPADAVGGRILRVVVENEKRAAALATPVAQDTRKPITSRFLTLMKEKLEPIAGLDDQPDPLAQVLADPNDPAAEAPGEPGELVPEGAAPKKPIRYLVVSGMLSEGQARAVKALKMTGVVLEKRQVREYPGGMECAAIVGKVGANHEGLLGAEKLLEKRLTGNKGHIDFVRDATGKPIWIEPGQIDPAQPGADVRLSIDLEVQRIAYEEVSRGIDDADTAGGRCLVIDSITGEILAMVDILRDPPDAESFPWADDPVVEPPPGGWTRRNPAPKKPPAPDFPHGHRWEINKPDPSRDIHPALARNRCVEDMYEPGSTFKPFVWSTITELGLARPDEVFTTGRGGWVPPDGRKPIKDVTARDQMTWCEVLVNSSNIGMIKGAQRLSYVQLHDAVTRFGFGKPTGLGLPGESPGVVTSMKNWKLGTQVSVAFGNEVAVTPLQMVRAFAAFARPGELAGTLPRLRLTMDSLADGPGVTYRVLPQSVAELARETMKGVTGSMETKYCPPPEGQKWRYTMFGKSGTSKIPVGAAPKGKRKMRGTPGYLDQYRVSFIAGAPIENPRLVVLVVMDDPGPERIRKNTYYGSMVSGPVVRRIMERTLTYLGTAPSLQPQQ
jgi:cell division protein FtsI (penicillin-binding protein 3)